MDDNTFKKPLRFCLKCDGLRDDHDICIFCGFDNKADDQINHFIAAVRSKKLSIGDILLVGGYQLEVIDENRD